MKRLQSKILTMHFIYQLAKIYYVKNFNFIRYLLDQIETLFELKNYEDHKNNNFHGNYSLCSEGLVISQNNHVFFINITHKNNQEKHHLKKI